MNQPLKGIYGHSGIEHANQVKDAGCNALWFHGFNEEGFSACEKTGLSPCVEFGMFRASYADHPELIPVGVDGGPIRYGRLVQGICLSKFEFIEGKKAELISGLSKFSPTGIWFDYLTGAGWFEVPDPDLQESCFCPDCIKEFCEATDVDADTPAQILSTYQKEWTDHKCERVAGYGREFTGIIKEASRDAVIGAYMCPWTPEEFDGAVRRIFGQDFELFAEFVDVFTPLFYVKKSGRTPEWSAEYLKASADFIPEGRIVQPILDAIDYPESLRALAASEVKSWGFQMFAGAAVFEDPESAREFAALSARF